MRIWRELCNYFVIFDASVRRETGSAGMQLVSAKSVTTNYVGGLPLGALFFWTNCPYHLILFRNDVTQICVIKYL